MNTLYVYGTSDDLVELEGIVRDEYDAWEGGVLTISTGHEYLKVECIYAHDGVWSFAPVVREDGTTPDWATRILFDYPNAPTYSYTLAIDLPDGEVSTGFQTKRELGRG